MSNFILVWNPCMLKNKVLKTTNDTDLFIKGPRTPHETWEIKFVHSLDKGCTVKLRSSFILRRRHFHIEFVVIQLSRMQVCHVHYFITLKLCIGWIWTLGNIKRVPYRDHPFVLRCNDSSTYNWHVLTFINSSQSQPRVNR